MLSVFLSLFLFHGLVDPKETIISSLLAAAKKPDRTFHYCGAYKSFDRQVLSSPERSIHGFCHSNRFEMLGRETI